MTSSIRQIAGWGKSEGLPGAPHGTPIEAFTDALRWRPYPARAIVPRDVSPTLRFARRCARRSPRSHARRCRLQKRRQFPDRGAHAVQRRWSGGVCGAARQDGSEQGLLQGLERLQRQGGLCDGGEERVRGEERMQGQGRLQHALPAIVRVALGRLPGLPVAFLLERKGTAPIGPVGEPEIRAVRVRHGAAPHRPRAWLGLNRYLGFATQAPLTHAATLGWHEATRHWGAGIVLVHAGPIVPFGRARHSQGDSGQL